jgi:hypothetical protein
VQDMRIWFLYVYYYLTTGSPSRARDLVSPPQILHLASSRFSPAPAWLVRCLSSVWVLGFRPVTAAPENCFASRAVLCHAQKESRETSARRCSRLRSSVHTRFRFAHRIC